MAAASAQLPAILANKRRSSFPVGIFIEETALQPNQAAADATPYFPGGSLGVKQTQQHAISAPSHGSADPVQVPVSPASWMRWSGLTDPAADRSGIASGLDTGRPEAPRPLKLPHPWRGSESERRSSLSLWIAWVLSVLALPQAFKPQRHGVPRRRRPVATALPHAGHSLQGAAAIISLAAGSGRPYKVHPAVRAGGRVQDDRGPDQFGALG